MKNKKTGFIRCKEPEEKKVKDIMSYGIPEVPEYSTVADVAKILINENALGVVVTNDKNDPLGAVSEIDIPKAFGRDFSRVKVTEIMSSPAKTIGMDESVKKAEEMMKNKNVHCLIVVDKKKRANGVVSVGDIIRKGSKTKVKL